MRATVIDISKLKKAARPGRGLACLRNAVHRAEACVRYVAVMVPNASSGDAVPEASRKTDEVRLAIEEARRHSVAEGCFGVLVERPVTGTHEQWRVHASHPDVPFGTTFERPIAPDSDDPPVP